MNRSNDDRLSILLDPLVQQAVDEAIERHRQRGESIAVAEDGKVRIVTSKEIPHLQQQHSQQV